MSKISASGQSLGYFYQEDRCLVWLLRSKPGDMVVFEKMGDVGVEKPDGSVVSEEDKSGTASNPIANRTIALWKSLSNWLDAILATQIHLPQTQFVLSVLQDHKGEWAQAMHDANTVDQAMELVQRLRKEFGQRPPAHGIKGYADRVLCKSNESTVLELIRRFHLETGSGHSMDAIRADFIEANQNIDASEADNLIESCIGWVHGEIMRQLEGGSGYAVIPVEQYRARLRELTLKLRDDRVLSSYVSRPPENEVDTTVHSQAVFLRQLELIEYSEERFEAARNFLWARSDITAWLEKGLVDQNGIDKFTTQLTECYKIHNKKSRLQYAGNEIAMGQDTYLACIQENVELEGKKIGDGSRFIPGVYHHLADEQHVGWHPRFQELLARDEAA
ncbi:MAG: hypothetical protein H7837_10520 [Magnetococcus sp. MYC-9]